MKIDPKLIQSYVRDRYFVSTAIRTYDTMEGASHGYETMAWEWNVNTKERGSCVAQDSVGSIEGAFRQHIELCQELASKCPEPTTYEG